MATTGNKAVHPTRGRSGLARVEVGETIVDEAIAFMSANKLVHAKVGKFIMSSFTVTRTYTIGWRTPRTARDEGPDAAYWGPQRK